MCRILYTVNVATIDEAVAQYLRSFREEHGLSLTQVADAAQKMGVKWGAASIRGMERGEAALTLDKLITLALAVRLLNGGTPVRLAELLGDADSFEIAPPGVGANFSQKWMAAVLSGAPVDPTSEGVKPPQEYKAALYMERDPERFGYPSSVTAEDIIGAVPTAAEKRAAKKLGIAPKALALWALHLWGHSLDAEASQRAGENATPQARGRVTRLLAEELETAYLKSRSGSPA